MRRGEIYWVDLEPVMGSEVGRRRPAIVLQNEMANRTSPTVTVIPVSSRVGRVYPFQVRLRQGEGGLSVESKALCEQVRTISRMRLQEPIGTLGEARLQELRTALERHLWL